MILFYQSISKRKVERIYYFDQKTLQIIKYTGYIRVFKTNMSVVEFLTASYENAIIQNIFKKRFPHIIKLINYA